MGGLRFDFRKLILILFVIALPLISINVERKPGETPWYMKPVVFVGGAVQGGYTSFSQGIRSTVSLYLNLIGVKKENRELRGEVASIRARLAALREIQIENERLEQLLNFKNDSEMDLLPARVIGYDLTFGLGRSTIRIGKGRNDGVKAGQAVVTPAGAVGAVLSTEEGFSSVLVLTDRFSAIDSVVQRSRARGVIVGKRSTVQLKYLQRSDDVQKGDLIVTSGIDNIYPKGYPLGRVISVEKKSYGITQKVEVEPIIDPFHIEEVFVVLNTNELKIGARSEGD